MILPKEDVFDRKTNMFAVIGADKMTDEIVLNGESYFNRNSKRHSNLYLKLYTRFFLATVSVRDKAQVFLSFLLSRPGSGWRMTVDQELCGDDQEEEDQDDDSEEPDNFTQLLEVCGRGGRLTRSRVGSRQPRSTSVLGSLRRFIKKEIQKRKQRLGLDGHLPRAQERNLASVAKLSFGSGRHRDSKLLFGQ